MNTRKKLLLHVVLASLTLLTINFLVSGCGGSEPPEGLEVFLEVMPSTGGLQDKFAISASATLDVSELTGVPPTGDPIYAFQYSMVVKKRGVLFDRDVISYSHPTCILSPNLADPWHPTIEYSWQVSGSELGVGSHDLYVVVHVEIGGSGTCALITNTFEARSDPPQRVVVEEQPTSTSTQLTFTPTHTPTQAPTSTYTEIPDTYEFNIMDVFYPGQVSTNQTFQVHVDVGYSFSTTSEVLLQVYEHAGPLVGKKIDKLVGSGSGTYSFDLTAPATPRTWQLNIHAFHFEDGNWVQDDIESIFIAVEAAAAPTLTLFTPEISGYTVTVNGVTLPGTSGATVTRINWDWGDGFSEDHWFPASHTYAKSGTYVITVTSYQSDGLSTAKSLTVIVKEVTATVEPATNRIYLISDNFESYSTGTFPSAGGWYERYDGAGHNVIDNAYAYSGSQSFRLQGRANWSATVENRVAKWQAGSAIMGYEYYVYPEGGEIGSSFYDYEPLWGHNWGRVLFQTDGYIYADSSDGMVRLMPYTANQWYKVMVGIDDFGHYAVWINDQFMGGGFASPPSPEHSIADSYFQIGSGHAGNYAWFDDVKVWYNPSNVLFQDDFNDGIPDGWTELGPGWSIQNGEYVISQNDCSKWSQTIAGELFWSNYAFEYDVMGTKGTDKPVSFRYLDANNRYWLDLISKTSWGWGPLVRFGKVEGGIETVLANVDFDNQLGVWYHVRIEVVSEPAGESIFVLVNDVPVLSYIDESSSLKNGMIALEGWTGDTCEGTVHFDNVEVTIFPSAGEVD